MDVSDIFYFFLLGGGKGESEAPGGGWGRFYMENPTRGGGGVSGWVGAGGGGCFRGIWGGRGG